MNCGGCPPPSATESRPNNINEMDHELMIRYPVQKIVKIQARFRAYLARKQVKKMFGFEMKSSSGLLNCG